MPAGRPGDAYDGAGVDLQHDRSLLGGARAEVRVRRQRQGDGRALLQGQHHHRHAHRSLWSSGNQLATATFSGETASGWQTVTFSVPVSIRQTRLTWCRITRTLGITPTPQSVCEGRRGQPASARAPFGNGVYIYGARAFPRPTRNQLLGGRDVRRATIRASPLDRAKDDPVVGLVAPTPEHHMGLDAPATRGTALIGSRCSPDDCSAVPPLTGAR